MRKQRHAEIAGAGTAGLIAATLLARAGWSVRVHERSDVIREIGAGIFLHNNGLLVLEETGLMDELAPRGTRLMRDRMVDWQGRAMQNRILESSVTRRWSFPRQALVEAVFGEPGERDQERPAGGASITAAVDTLTHTVA